MESGVACVMTLRILTLKSNKGTKSGALKKPMFSLFDYLDVIICSFNGKIKQNITGMTSSEQCLK